MTTVVSAAVEDGREAAPARMSAPPPLPGVLRTVTDAELDRLELPPLNWVIPGVLPEGLSILVGNPKVGKSAMVLGWAHAVAEGLPVMGSIAVKQSVVLYLALEDNRRRVQDRIRGLRPGTEGSTNLHFWTMDTLPRFRRLDDGGKEDLEGILDAQPDCRMVIIDTWSKVKPGRRSKNQQLYDVDSEAWSILHEITSRRRIAILVVHHTKKSLTPEGDWIYEVSGTQGITGTVDTIMLLRRKRGEKVATLMVTGRDLDEDKEYLLHGDPSTKTWTLGTGSLKRCQLNRAQQDIVDAIKHERLAPKEISTKLGHNDSNKIRPVLMRMCKDGLLLVDPDGRYHLNPELINGTNSSNDDDGRHANNGVTHETA